MPHPAHLLHRARVHVSCPACGWQNHIVSSPETPVYLDPQALITCPTLLVCHHCSLPFKIDHSFASKRRARVSFPPTPESDRPRRGKRSASPAPTPRSPIPPLPIPIPTPHDPHPSDVEPSSAPVEA